MHYLQITDFKEKTHRITDYADLLSKKVDPVTAATEAFGDLKRLQATLDNYVRQRSYSYFKVPGDTGFDDSSFKVEPLTETQADAVRADFLAYNSRTTDAKELLDRVLKQDPKNVSAYETKGYMAFRQGQTDEATKWYTQAVQLDSQSFLAHYYFAAMTMSRSMDPEEQTRVENSLRTAIKLNPDFAPAYDRLGVFLSMQRGQQDDARLQLLHAVQIDPGNFGYRINVANVLMQMGRANDAITVIKNAMHLAKPDETSMAQIFLEHAEEYANAQQRNQEYEEQQKDMQQAQSDNDSQVTMPKLIEREEVLPGGPHHFLVGVVKDVHCGPAATPIMDFSLVSRAKTLGVHSGNYYKIKFTALNFMPQGDFNPCEKLEGMSAKVEYVESSDTPPVDHVVAVELHK